MAKVLIVEDNDMLSKAYRLMLSHHGHMVELAYNGKQGLERASVFQPEIILLDYLMPVMDGRTFLQQYDPLSHPDVKILLLTNLDEEERIQEAYELGIRSHVLKAQLAPQELTAKIAELLV